MAAASECDPDKCDHPGARMFWYDDSVCCYKCRQVWHDNYPPQAGPKKLWGFPDPKYYACQCTGVRTNPECILHGHHITKRFY